MTDRPNDSVNKRADSDSRNDTHKNAATPRSSDSDTESRESGHTKSGQEAVRGVAPGAHDDEHQSNYGGGGVNGGSDGSKR